MNKLKEEFEHLEFKEIITYHNSGNIIFNSNNGNKNIIKDNIQSMIKNKFELDIPVYVITSQELEELLNNNPDWWGKNDKEIYDNIIFVIPPLTYENVLSEIGLPNEYEKIKEYKSNIFWSYSLKDYKKTNWWSKTASTSISNSITIRTANTMKKILEICKK